MDTIKAIKKHSAQHDLFHRLHSVNADAAFVRLVANEWYDGRFPVVPNLRCGAWYCDPSSSSSQYAYFKSTDGHTNNWSFNLRRSNLGLAKYAEDHGGIILVDSTRRGKRMPDALSKTVPIWCAVINLALALCKNSSKAGASSGDTGLYLPPNIVSPSEKAQIEDLLPGWAASLERSKFPLPELQRPLRPFFVHPSTSSPPHIPLNADFTPIICLSASRWIAPESLDDIPSITRLSPSENGDSRTVGFEYVQGAGDDHESWGRGLTPELFHVHKDRLLRAERETVPDVVDDILLAGKSAVLNLSPPILDYNLNSASSPIGMVGFPSYSSRLALDIGPSVDCTPPWSFESDESEGYQTIWIASSDNALKNPLGHVLRLDADNVVFACPSARDAGKEYAKALGDLVAHAREVDPSKGLLLRLGDQRHLDLALCSSSPTSGTPPRPADLAPLPPSSDHRKMILPLALAIAMAVPHLCKPAQANVGGERPIFKADIAQTLHQLVTLWPDGNPPRAALKRVNEFLMSGAYRNS